MASSRTLLFLFLILVPAFNLPGTAQDSQDAFAKELIAACQENDVSRLQSLINEHRLWVKPVVNQLISDYIDRTMTGSSSRAASLKDAATLIAKTFEETYGEKSLSIAIAYLDTWGLEQLGKKAQADRIYGIATDLRISGQNNEEAIGKFHQALELYIDIGDVRGQGEVLGGLGAMYWGYNNDSCLTFYQRALKARREVDDRVLIASMLNGMGRLYFFYIGDVDSARTYFTEAVQFREEIGDLVGLGSSLILLGDVYEYMSESEEAIRCFDQAYANYRQLEIPKSAAEAKIRSGTNLRQLGRYPVAIQDLETAIDIGLDLSDTIVLADAYNQQALVFDNIGDYETGIELVTIATRLYQQINDQWGLAGAYNHTGIILQDAGRKPRAEEFYKNSLEIYRQLDDQENVISVLNNLATVTFELNEFVRAEDYNKQGLELSRNLDFKKGELPCLINLANTQNRLDQLDTALKNYDLALKLSRDLNSPDREWRVLVGIAENYKLRGDYPKAIEYNEKGLSIIEDLRGIFHSTSERSNYLARERYAFEDVIHMLAEQHLKDPGKGYDLLAFEYAQRCKSRSFLEQIKGTEPVTLKQVQNAGLDKNSVILEYSLGDSSSVLWVITPDTYQMIRLPDRKTLEEQVETLRFALLNPDQDNLNFLQQAGHYLYNNLIEPAEQYISRKSQVVILPDGILHYIPFEVLITREPVPGKDLSHDKLSYLGMMYPVCYGQSASAYVSMIADRSTSSRKQHQTKELVAFGDPIYQGKYKRLEYSGEEIWNIAALFPEDQVRTYIQEKATEEQFKNEKGLSEFRYIHFATHGLLDEQNPGRSGLVLSQDRSSSEDGIIRADEIAALKLNADLVVLSACQTGIGKMIRGEGMIGLSRSFIYAGAPAVIVSLWSVSDQSTSLLMKRFYENLVEGHLSKAEALQQARITMLKDELYAHPFFWAPFVLTGDWQ